MIINEKIKYRVIPNTRKYYISKGYMCNNYDLIEINVMDLPTTSFQIDFFCVALKFFHFLQRMVH